MKMDQDRLVGLKRGRPSDTWDEWADAGSVFGLGREAGEGRAYMEIALERVFASPLITDQGFRHQAVVSQNTMQS